jgi:sulfite exporter TauE/SafE/copper chaperone CopZ
MAQKKEVFHINGMTCTSCEVIIERKLKKIDGILSAEVTHSTGDCTVTTESGSRIQRKDVEKALSDTEYELVGSEKDVEHSFSWKHLLKIGAVVLVIYIVVSQLGILSFDTAIDDTLSYGAIFGIGLIASVSSCIAVVGGLVLTFTATVKRTNPMASKWQLLRAHLFFNGGRLIGYFLLGGLVAVIGSVLAPSPRIMGIIALLAALVMILLALDLLGLSGSKKWIPRMPKKWSHWIHDMADREEWWIPAALGALTFFLPCGFTQSMQLYALTTGTFMQGALTLFVFALGTLPALLGIGALASITSSRGKAYRWFMLIAGCLVLLLGLYNVKNSLNLLGVNTNSWFESSENVSTGTATVTDSVQVVEMAVDGIDYIPSKMTIQKDVPVEWVIDGSGAVGCTSVIAIPSLGISKSLSSSAPTTVAFTPTKSGRLSFTCGMGMSYGEFDVVESLPDATEECDSAIQTCSTNT